MDMATCLNDHQVPVGVAFCHTCGAPLPEPRRAPSHIWQYVSIASVLVIVLGLIGIAWILRGRDGGREATAPDAGVSVCGLLPTYRPTHLDLACGNAVASLTDVTWSQWNNESATGTGTYSWGKRSAPATVVLGRARNTSSGPQFTQVTVTPQGGRPISQAIATYSSADSSVQARLPIGGSACAAPPDGAAVGFGVIGTHTSCDFAGQVRRAYLAAGGHGQALRVVATSTVTHRTYRNIACSSGRYVVCVGGEGDTAKVFMGPFAV